MKQKIKLEDITGIRKDWFEVESWLKSKTRVKDTKCEHCKKLYNTMDRKVGLMFMEKSVNKHICGECADFYIGLGVRDVLEEQQMITNEKNDLIEKIREYGTYRETGLYARKLDDMEMDDIKNIYFKHRAMKEKQDRIDAVVISEEDSFMEPYLKTHWDVLQDTKWLKCEEQIEDYFKDCHSNDYFECGQGYCQDEADVIIKIAKKFYSVHIVAEIGSAKQDVGDRLYWVEDIESVTWKEIDKPEPKKALVYDYSMKISEEQKEKLETFMDENKMIRL